MRVLNVGVVAALVALCVAQPCSAADRSPANNAAQDDHNSSGHDAARTGAASSARAAGDRVGSLSADEARRASRARKRAEAAEQAATARRRTDPSSTRAHELDASGSAAAATGRTHATAASRPTPAPVGSTATSPAAGISHPLNAGKLAASQQGAGQKNAGDKTEAERTPTHPSRRSRIAVHRGVPRVGDLVPPDAPLARLPRRYSYPPRYADNDPSADFGPRRRRFYYADPRFGAPYPPYPSPYRFAAPGYYPRAYYEPY